MNKCECKRHLQDILNFIISKEITNEEIGKNSKTVAFLDALELEIERIMGILPRGTLGLLNGDGKQNVLFM